MIRSRRLLSDRVRPEPASGVAVSAAASDGVQMRTEDVAGWLAQRVRAGDFRVQRIPFADLDGWVFDERTGNLGHRSGRFFTVEGLHVAERGSPYGDGPPAEWRQPIIRQAEVGVLGILVKEFGGVPHLLMQAKMEPGNPNLVQLSPTVQATRSNYTRAHQGARVKYIEYFTGPDRGRVIADVLQSEHGSWFFRKANRNMVVQVSGDVPVLENFCWLTLGQIADLLRHDNTVNMDARTVLACLPWPDDGAGALLSDLELLSWITGERARHHVTAERIGLASLPGWKHGSDSIEHEHGRYFRVVAVAVQAGSREVAGWTQPLFAPVDRGVTAFLVREFAGVLHVLVHARVEGGFLDTVELGPTVQYTPHNYAHLAGPDRPRFLDLVLGAGGDRIRYQAVHSEEGGRFLNAESQYLIVDADESEAPQNPPPGYAWATPAQLSSLLQHGHYVNVQARTLLACLNATTATPR